MFDWGSAKSAINKAKHGISFAEAVVLWENPIVSFHSSYPGEERELVLGKIAGKHWTAIVARRAEVTRIISVRRSRDEEREIYQQNNPE